MAISLDDPETLEAIEQLRFQNYVSFLKIDDRRTNELVPLVLNPVQLKLWKIVEAKLAAGVPVRIIILKSRRMGISTLIQAIFAHRAFTTFRFTAKTGAHEHFASSTLHRMTEQMHRNLPDELRPAKVVGQQGRVLELETDSSLSTFTAKGGDGVGRSMAARGIHASEVGFWDDAATSMAALKQIVPDEPETFVFVESTAQGIGDYFHTECVRAMNGESEYEFVFFGWFEFPDYRRPVPEAGLGELDAEELALVETFGVDRDQLAWRRHAIANECNGSLDTFHEEYPATWQEAFLSSGRPLFTGLSEVPTSPPRFVGEIDGLPVKGGAGIKFVRRRDGRIKIWEAPKRGMRKYVIGADCAGSVVQAEHSARAVGQKVDAYCAYVVDVETARTVACFHARGITEKAFARELAALAFLYCDAEVAVERAGGYGTATLIELRDAWPRTWIYEHVDDDSTQRDDLTGAMGFPMTSVTRPLVIGSLDVLLRETPECIRDDELVGEMRTFVTTKSGKLAADTGCHDDRVMARAIAAWVRNLRATRVVRAPLTAEQRRKRDLAERTRDRNAINSILARVPRLDPRRSRP